MRRQAILPAATGAKRNAANDPATAFAEPDIAAATAGADINSGVDVKAAFDIGAGFDMAATMAASYWIGLLFLGMELPLGIARSSQAITGAGATN